MRIFIPSTKGNGGSREKRPKRGTRRERRKEAREVQALEIERMIEARNNKRLGIAPTA